MHQSYEIKQKKAAQAIQNRWFDRKFSTAYGRMREQFFDISTSSKENMRNLYRELRDRTLLPVAERAKYPQNSLFLAKEWEMRETWFDQLVPLMTGKHAAARVTFKKLIPTAMRQRIETSVQVNNTGVNALTEFSFFVLGLGEKHSVPAFLDYNVETIIAAIGKLTPEQQSHFRGFWVSNEFISDREGMVLYGNTKRTVFFDSDKRTKTYTYVRANGETIIRTVAEKEEVFSADRNLQAIWDALFALFIIELRCLGGTIQELAFKHSRDAKVLGHLYSCLFRSFVFPEAKLPQELALDKPFIKIERQNGEFFNNATRWFYAARVGDVDVLKQMIHDGWPIDMTDEKHNTALLLAVGGGHTKAAKLLLMSGADMGIRNRSNQKPFHIALEQANRDLVIFMLSGITDPILPEIKHYPAVNKKSVYDLEPLQQSLGASADPSLFWLLIDHGAEITPDLPVILWMYQSGFKDQLPRLKKLGANINATDLSSGKSVLMVAAERGDVDFTRTLLATGADVNQTVSLSGGEIDDQEGQTALFFAAGNGHTQVMKLLLEKGANAQHCDFHGRSVYKWIAIKLARGIEGYIHDQSTYIQATIAARLHIGPKTAAVGLDLQEMVIKSQWKDIAAKLTQAKQFLEQAGLAEPVNFNKDLVYIEKRVVAAVAIITGSINGEPHVLVIQHGTAGKPTLSDYYQFPGGLAEKYDANPGATAIREAAEETGIHIPQQHNGQIIYLYEFTDLTEQKKTLRQTYFYHIDLGTDLIHRPVVAKSEVAHAFYMNLNQVKYDAKSNGYYFNGTRIAQSNILMVRALIAKQPLPRYEIGLSLSLQEGNQIEVNQAVFTQNHQRLRFLYQNGVNLDQCFALVSACANNIVDLIPVLQEMGCHVDTILNNAKLPTVLMAALYYRADDAVRYLVEYCSANINIYHNGFCALTIACAHNPKMVDYLLTHGARVDHNIGGEALLALMSATRGAQDRKAAGIEILSLAKRLFNLCHIDLNRQYNSSRLIYALAQPVLPLCLAVELAIDGYCPVELVHLLLANGASAEVMRGSISLLKYVQHRHETYDEIHNYLQSVEAEKKRRAAKQTTQADNTNVKRASLKHSLFGDEEEHIKDQKQQMGDIAAITQIEQWLAERIPRPILSPEEVELQNILKWAQAAGYTLISKFNK